MAALTASCLHGAGMAALSFMLSWSWHGGTNRQFLEYILFAECYRYKWPSQNQCGLSSSSPNNDVEKGRGIRMCNKLEDREMEVLSSRRLD